MQAYEAQLPGDQIQRSAKTMDYLENKTFDEIKIGDTASITKTLTNDDIEKFTHSFNSIASIIVYHNINLLH